MKCPYCNKYLKQVRTTAYCYWCGCDKTDGMFGTLTMWKKVASLVKIRNAGKKYQSKTRDKIKTILEQKEHFADASKKME